MSPDQVVSEILVDGVTVTEVALRLGVSRQTVHAWLRRYRNGGIGDLATGRPGRTAAPTRPRPSSSEWLTAEGTSRRSHRIVADRVVALTSPMWTRAS